MAKVQEDIWVEGVSLGSLGRRRKREKKWETGGSRREQDKQGTLAYTTHNHTMWYTVTLEVRYEQMSMGAVGSGAEMRLYLHTCRKQE